MEIAYIVLAVIVAAMLTRVGAGKVPEVAAGDRNDREQGRRPESRLHWLGMAEIAGAIGLLIGIAWRPLGIAAGVGITLYFVGAVIGHLRVHDTAWKVPLFLAILGVVVTGLAIATVDC